MNDRLSRCVTLGLTGALLALAGCGDDGGPASEDTDTTGGGGTTAVTTSSTTAGTTATSGTSTTTDGPTSTTGDMTTGDGSSSTGSEAVCGNGQVEDGEDCDDQNEVDGDGCNNDCVESGKVLWEHVYDGPAADGEDQAIDLAFGPDGSVFMTGQTRSETEEANDILIYGLSTEGEELWVVIHDSDGDPENDGGFTDRGQSIAVEADGEVVVAGYEMLTDESVWVGKYGATGDEVWTHSDAAEDGRAYAVDVDDEGHVFVAGTFGLTAFLRQMNTNGVEFWTEERSGTGGCNGCDAFGAVVSVPNGVIVGGDIDNDDADAWVGWFDFSGTEAWSDTDLVALGDTVVDLDRGADHTFALVRVDDYTTVELRSYTDAGNVQWVLDDVFDGHGYGALAATADGGYVTTFASYDVGTEISTYTISRYDSDSGLQWTRDIDVAAGGYAEVYSIAVAPDGRVGISGYRYEADAADGDAYVAVLAP